MTAETIPVPAPLRTFEEGRADFTAARQNSPVPPATAPPESEAPRTLSRLDVSQFTSAELVAFIDEMPHVGAAARGERTRRRTIALMVLQWLEQFPGRNWQERWQRSGIEVAPLPAKHILGDTATERREQSVRRGLAWVLASGAISPGYPWLYRQPLMRDLHRFVLPAVDPVGLQRVADTIANQPSGRADWFRSRVLPQLARICIHQRSTIGEITFEDWMEAWRAGRDIDLAPYGTSYDILYQMGNFRPGSPSTLRQARIEGQKTVEARIEKYGIQSQRIKNVLITYIRERAVNIDYSSATGLITHLCRNFWRDIEVHHPGIDTLRLPGDVIAAWKERVAAPANDAIRSTPRSDPHAVFLAVRAMYADLNNWAAIDPERWGEFAAPNPIHPPDTRTFAKMKRRQRAESHERTRERAPLLPQLWDYVCREYRTMKRLRAHAHTVGIGQEFRIDDFVFTRVGRIAGPHSSSSYYFRTGEGAEIDAFRDEDVAFWTWAAVGILKETGIRIEELVELTHTSITQYRIPATGELMPLLQIAPSKTDQERLIPVSPELADILAAVISRVRTEDGSIPVLRRYDSRERLVSEPLPFLLQRRVYRELRVITEDFVRKRLRALTDEAGLVDGAGRAIRFSPHDFRRIFATEAISAGLPVHIAAKILGHESLDTTQVYNAIYDEEVIRHHRAFIARRRALRPQLEYRPPTDEEWDDFLGHFERRKVELGNCGRAYGAPCAHEHACVRCSMLQMDPAMRTRLEEIVANLEARIAEAHEHRWFGEIEGLEVSLAAGREKLRSLDRRESAGPVSLGLPTLRPPMTLRT